MFEIYQLAPAEPRSGHPGQLAGLPREQQRREGRGRCVRRVVCRCAEDAGEGARRLAREGGGSRRRRRRAWDYPSVAGRRRRAEDPILGPSLSASGGRSSLRWGRGTEPERCAARSRRLRISVSRVVSWAISGLNISCNRDPRVKIVHTKTITFRVSKPEKPWIKIRPWNRNPRA
jgi:hypothetical protein